MIFVLVLLLVLAALTAMSWALLGTLDNLPIPDGCPFCGGSARSWGAGGRDWFERRGGVLHCRHCGARFHEQHDGSLNEEPSDS